MKILDLDMDYFMERIATDIPPTCTERLPEEYYGKTVWVEERVRTFLEKNLGLSKDRKVRGRVVSGHNESLFFWKELIERGILSVPFEVIHVDSHADLGLGFSSWEYISDSLLQYPVSERPMHNQYMDGLGKMQEEGIGDYLLFAIAYRWIHRLTYCANPNGDKNDYVYETLKDYHENYIWDEPVENIIQLVCNPDMDFPKYKDSAEIKMEYLNAGIREPEVPLLIIPTVEGVRYDEDFDFAVLAQSPNYTPESADFIVDIFREYIDEC